MRKFSARVTSKGQVTIPVEVRRLLEVSGNDEVGFAVEQSTAERTPQQEPALEVRLYRPRGTEADGGVVERTAGALSATGEKPRGATQLREDAECVVAEEAVKRSKS